MAGEGPLPPVVVRNLSDKLYEKRKSAALEIESMVKEFGTAATPDSEARILSVIRELDNRFCKAPHANSRKGGLIGLAATALASGDSVGKYLESLFPPVLGCFVDPDFRVRYYACEAMYNICKVARQHTLKWFSSIFDGMCRLVADTDENVKSGAALLDRLMKDLVAECPGFEVKQFVTLLRDRTYVTHPNVRQLLLSWITVLDSVPDIEMLDYLPNFLDGLLNMLSDPSREIRKMADSVLNEFMKQIRSGREVNTSGVVEILIPVCKETHPNVAKDDFTRLTALNWLNQYLLLKQDKIMLPFTAEILSAVLPCLAQNVKDIRAAALQTLECLNGLFQATPAEDMEIGPVLGAVTLELVSEYEATRMEALRWILALHDKVPAKVMAIIDSLFPALLKMLSDRSEHVVQLVLDVLARISKDEGYFKQFMSSLIKLFGTDRHLLENRGSLIVRQLSLFLDPVPVFRALSNLLKEEEDLEFCAVMVTTLNLILLTSVETFEMREMLKKMEDTAAWELFICLYESWCHSPVAAVCLCLLSQCYEHASGMVLQFASFDVTVPFLLEVDKLVQLIESPIFLHVRLHLLEPRKHPFLYKCLYGILMLLPQSAAFVTLRNRMDSVATFGQLNLMPASYVGLNEKRT